MSPDTLKRLAIAVLALSIAAIAWSLRCSWQAGRIFGPGALVAATADEVWLSVDDQLWRTRADGHLLSTHDWTALGVPGKPANLLRHPDGPIVATVRNDPTLYFLDPSTARVVRSVRPRWPAEMASDGERAINLAFHRDGRFAVATGGGHKVVLFDGSGTLLAQTAPGTYRFTNGLWWVGDALWTTSTDDTELKRLNPSTLAVEQKLALPSDASARYLGPARVHPQAGTAGRPMAALIRFTNGMVRGTVTMVHPDGRETALQPGRLEVPRDLEWLAGDLLVSDGAAFSVQRWGPEGQARTPFGDDAVQSRLKERFESRWSDQRHHQLWLGGGIVLFGLAMVLLLAARRASREQQNVDLSALGTPGVTQGQLIWLVLQVAIPTAIALLPVIVITGFPSLLKSAHAAWGLQGKLVFLGVTFLWCAAGMYLCWVQRQRQLTLPRFEPVFNFQAMHRLRTDTTLPRVLEPGEPVRETFMLQGRQLQGFFKLQSTTLRWMVLTDRRLLSFKLRLLDTVLEKTFALAEIASVSQGAGASAGMKNFFTRNTRKNFADRPWIDIRLRDGESIVGAMPCAPLTERVAKRLGLQRTPAPPAAV
jgi:hypothetical protein